MTWQSHCQTNSSASFFTFLTKKRSENPKFRFDVLVLVANVLFSVYTWIINYKEIYRERTI